MNHSSHPIDLLDALRRAIDRRAPLLADDRTSAFRLFHGGADGIPGLYVDLYETGATLIRYVDHDLPPRDRIARALIEVAAPLGVRAVYDKPFIPDRSRTDDRTVTELHDPTPILGPALPDALVVRELAGHFEVHLFDGFSTGLFLDQRENRALLQQWCRQRASPNVANLFAYTGAFSVACALAGAQVSTIDISPRYLRWAKRNFNCNDLDPEDHHFARMDAREFLAMAARKELRFDLIILDPPTFGSADKRRSVAAWSSERDFADLLRSADAALSPGGVIFASTNTRALCKPGEFDRLIDRALGLGIRRLGPPPRQIDFPAGDAYPCARLLEI